ncbi:uncharacterized protein LOC110642325 isoform X1 [Hevea brasiliensis]|nr:uncharacterized protein LOC110642325 isoform X1 [Hevea brasiliensis]
MPPKRRAHDHEASSSCSSQARPHPTQRPRCAAPPSAPENPPQPQPTLPWGFQSLEHKEKYISLARRPVVCTKYIDTYTLEQLGLSEEVGRFVERIGWTQFVSLKHHTYPELTLEFLSSFSCVLQPNNVQDVGIIKFRLVGVDYQLNMSEFNGIFGFANDGVRHIPKDFDMEFAWSMLTNTANYNASASKSTKLTNPAFRYLHRFMSHSIFGRGESTGVVSRNELFFLWAMETGQRVNTGYWLSNQFSHVARGNGKIVVGGLITAISVHFGFVGKAHRLMHLIGDDRIDLELLHMMKMCVREGGVYCLVDENGIKIPMRGVDRSDGGADKARVEDRTQDAEQEVRLEASPAPTAVDHPVASAQQGAITLEMLMARIDDRFDQIEERLHFSFRLLRTTIEQMDSRLGRLEDDVDERLASIEGTLEDLRLNR